MKIKGRVTSTVLKSCCDIKTEHTVHFNCCSEELDTFLSIMLFFFFSVHTNSQTSTNMIPLKFSSTTANFCSVLLIYVLKLFSNRVAFL